MLTPTILTFMVLILLLAFVFERRLSNLNYQVLGPDNSWVTEVHSRTEAIQLKKKGYQVFKEVSKKGFIYFKQI